MEACVLSPKGKLAGLVKITMTEEALFVEADESLKEELPMRLERYLVADDVTLEIIEPPEVIHVFGALAQDPSIQAIPGIIVSRLGLLGKDFDISFQRSLPALSSVESFSEGLVELLRIERAIPRWGIDVTSETLPPEAHLEYAIDYEKGCYVGQEVISRLRSVGRVNRLLCSLLAEPGNTLLPGIDLFLSEGSDQRIGWITSVAEQYDTERWIGLGYLKREHIATGARFVAVDPVAGKRTIVTQISAQNPQ
jgi:folate-binding protein YgfZ